MSSFSKQVFVEVRALNYTFDDDNNKVWVDSHEDYLNFSQKFEINVVDKMNGKRVVLDSFELTDLSDTLDKMAEISESNPSYNFEKANMPEPIYRDFMLLNSPTLTM